MYQSMLSDLENGRQKRLDFEVAVRVADALDISLDLLAGRPPRGRFG